MNIHSSAVVHPGAELAAGVSVGPGVVIGEHAVVGEKTEIGPHAVITGHTTIGAGCRIFTGAVVGSAPQDLKYRGEKSYLRIGDDNTIREYVTINPATEAGGETVIGNGNLIMAYSHVAHNCRIGNGTVLANNATMAGHVVIEDHVILGGMCAVHQFCALGAYAIIGGCSKITRDIPPYSLADGYPARVFWLNRVGLKRHKFPPETLSAITRAFRLLLRSGLNVSQAVARIRADVEPIPEIVHLLDFITRSRRGLAVGGKKEWKRLD